MTTTIFGIKNCDTMKKAQKWLTTNNITFTFHDYRKDGIDRAWLITACQELGWETVLNKRGTTYRQLPDETKQNLTEENVIDLLLEHPAMIKRPILETNGQRHIGFKDAQYQTIFEK